MANEDDFGDFLGFGEDALPAHSLSVPYVAMGRVGRTRARLGFTHWGCADGRVVRPDEMTWQHMLNVVRMCATQMQRRFAGRTYGKYVHLVRGRSPVLHAMCKLLELRGIDPYNDYGPFELTDYATRREYFHAVTERLNEDLRALRGGTRVRYSLADLRNLVALWEHELRGSGPDTYDIHRFLEWLSDR